MTATRWKRWRAPIQITGLVLALLLVTGTIIGSAIYARHVAVPQSLPAKQTPSPPPTSAPPPTPTPDPEPEPEPDNDWRFGSPEDHGMSPEALAQMHEAAAGTSVRSIVTVRDGVIVDEFYADGFDTGSVLTLQSGSKSVLSALIGVAIDEGVIGSVDDPLADYLPEVADLPDPRWRQITLRHLLTHTSGMDWPELYGSIWWEYQAAPNWVDFILNRPLIAEPGSVYEYNTGNTHLLSLALERTTGMAGADYGEQHLFGPLGMDSVEWTSDPQGIVDGGNGINMTSRDAARFGQLYLQDGRWHDDQLIPEAWVEASTRPQSTGPAEGTSQYGRYGYQWWVRDFDGVQTSYAWGAYGQFILIVPELDLVTVITGDFPLAESWSSVSYFTDYVLPATGS